MEDPHSEISTVVHLLTQTPPSAQRETIERYFTRNASFTHPFCRTGSWELNDEFNSRELIRAIYRWYKILSPRIDLNVDSVAYDVKKQTLYLHISQVFRIWIIPFYAAPVKFVTVLRLEQDKQTRRYLIRSQEDLYQVNEFVKFFLPGGFVLVWLWQVLATLACLIGTVVAWPQTWVEERVGRRWRGVAGNDK